MTISPSANPAPIPWYAFSLRSHNGEGFEGREYRIGHMYRRSFGDISGSGQGCAPDSAAG